MDTQTLMEKVVTLLEDAGAYQMSRFRKNQPGSGDEKSDKEFVSEVDLKTEHMLADGLKIVLPEAAFFGEETSRDRDSLTWVVDPLDGTTNFLSGYDHFSISVALVESDNPVPLLGAVYRPCTKELYSGIRGKGAWFTSYGEPARKLGVAHTIPLSRSLIGTGFPYRTRETEPFFYPCAQDVLHGSRGIRRSGSAALDLSFVAAGFLQAFWEVDLQPYDVAAAVLFLHETGCRVTAFNGSSYNMFQDRTIVAGMPGAAQELQEIVFSHYRMWPDQT